MCRMAWRLQGSGVIGYLPVAISRPVLIEKFRPVKDHSSIGKPNHYAVVTTVYFQYADGIMRDRHTCHPKKIGENSLSSDKHSASASVHVAKTTGECSRSLSATPKHLGSHPCVIPGMARESLPWGHDDLKRYGVKSGQGPSRSDDGQKKRSCAYRLRPCPGTQEAEEEKVTSG